MDEISRSRFLTPASRVYRWMIVCRASSVKTMFDEVSPLPSTDFFTRNRLAISVFSCSV